MNELTAIFFLCTTALLIYLSARDSKTPSDFHHHGFYDGKTLATITLIVVQQIVIVVWAGWKLFEWVF